MDKAQPVTLFVYTEEAAVPDEAIELMKSSGIVPVQVSDLSEYEINTILPPADISLIGSAAIEALLKADSFSEERKRFAGILLKSASELSTHQ